MPKFTETLELKKTNMETDGDDLFDFGEDLDRNWEKIDERFTCENIVISPDAWEGTSAPYSQTIEFKGMNEKINPHATLEFSEDYETAQAEKAEFAKIFKGVSGENTITFYAESPTGITLNVKIKRL